MSHTEPLDFDRLEIGAAVGPFRYRIPAGFNEKRLAALGVLHDGLLLDADGREFAEPSLLCGQHSWTFRQRFHWSGSVHAKCSIEYFAFAYVDSDILVHSRIAEKYERRGGRYVVFELENTDADGKPIARVRNTILLNYAEVRANRRGAPASPPEAQEAQEAAPARFVVGPMHLDREPLIRYFECEEAVYGELNTIHTDAGRAHRLGLPDIIAPGRYALGFFQMGLIRLAGPSWLCGARFDFSIRNNVAPGVSLLGSARRANAGAEASGPAADEGYNLELRDEISKKIILSGTFKPGGRHVPV